MNGLYQCDERGSPSAMTFYAMETISTSLSNFEASVFVGRIDFQRRTSKLLITPVKCMEDSLGFQFPTP